jgi:hypothetical protein
MSDYVVKPIGGVGQKLDQFMIHAEAQLSEGSTFHTNEPMTQIDCDVWAVYEYDHTVGTVWVVPWTLQPSVPVDVKVIDD